MSVCALRGFTFIIYICKVINLALEPSLHREGLQSIKHREYVNRDQGMYYVDCRSRPGGCKLTSRV